MNCFDLLLMLQQSVSAKIYSDKLSIWYLLSSEWETEKITIMEQLAV